jgi:hypothetical protein
MDDAQTSAQPTQPMIRQPLWRGPLTSQNQWCVKGYRGLAGQLPREEEFQRPVVQILVVVAITQLSVALAIYSATVIEDWSGGGFHTNSS